MKKYIFIFCLFTLAVACSKDSDEIESEVINPNDLDGDGVTNEIEIVDGTDPNDPCSVEIGHIYYPNLSQAWKLLDCDGDGVTNWDEMDPDGNGTVENNGTSPMWECDVNVAYQTLTPSEFWSNLDCDGDGFSNRQEVLDNTDIHDWCDFILGNQDIEFNAEWLEFDCDDDGRNNGQEISQGTDPLDPNNFFGSGDFLKEIIGLGGNSHFYSENGNRYDQTLDYNGLILVNFQYDLQNRLISVINNGVSVLYEYQGDQVSQIIITENGNQREINVVYDENIIYTYDGTEPVGQFSGKYTFEPVEGKVILIETFQQNNGITHYTSQILTYDSTYKNLIRAVSNSFGYNTVTGEFYDIDPVNGTTFTQNYSYNEDVRNPLFNSSQSIYINFLLVPNIMGNGWMSDSNSNAYFSENFLLSYSFHTWALSHTFSYGVHNVQSNGLPVLAYQSDFSLHLDFEFYYE